MIGTHALLSGLERRGVCIVVNREHQLRARERWPGAFTPRLRALADRHRVGLLAALAPRRSPVCVRCGRHHFPKPTTCWWCRAGMRTPTGAGRVQLTSTAQHESTPSGPINA